MKFLLVSGKLSYSNPAVYTLELANGLRRRGHGVEVAFHGGALAERLTEFGVENYQVKHNYFSFRRLIQFVRDFEPDVIVATGGHLALASAARISRRVDIPYIHTLHSWLPEDREERYPADLAGIVAVNEDLRELLVNDANVAKGRIRVIPYGVPDCKLDRACVEQRHTGRIPVVGTIGRLTQGRRHDEFLQAAALVRARLSDVHFVVAGDGEDEGRLRKLSRSLGITDVVTFVQPSSSVEIFSVLDLLVIVSDWGGVGLNLLEAMVHGCPVIATGGGEVFAVLGEPETCRVVPGNDTERLAAEIVALLEDPAARTAMALRARDHVLAQYPLDLHLQSVGEYCEGLLAITP